jgi:hypothetical protein
VLSFTENMSWQLGVLPLNLAEYSSGSFGSGSLIFPDTYSGPVTVRFSVVSGGGQVCLDNVIFGSDTPEPELLYLPLILKNFPEPQPTPTPTPPPTPTPQPGFTCPATSNASFATIPVDGPPSDRPDYLHGDLNLAQRGYVTVTTLLELVDYGGATDAGAPKLYGIFGQAAEPTFVSAHQVYDWNWACNTHGCRGDLLSQWPTTLVGLQTTPGQPLYIPTRTADIYNGQYHAVVLYAEETRLTLAYLRQDTVAFGYAVHFEDFCVDANLLALYRQQVGPDGYRVSGYQLPALSNGQAIGVAASSSVKIAIRDRGAFMDPRSQKDWW